MAAKAKSMFGVYQRETGSYTFGGVAFRPGRVVAVDTELAEACQQGDGLVTFYRTAKAAQGEVEPGETEAAE